MNGILPPLSLSALGWFAFVAALSIGAAVVTPIITNAVGSLKRSA